MTDPFKTIEMLARERNEMLANLTRTQERLARYIEVGRCAKALLEAEQARDEALTETYTEARGQLVENERRAHAALAVAVQALELGPEGASMLTPPAPAVQVVVPLGVPAVRVTAGVAGHGGVHTGHPDCPMTDPKRSIMMSNCTCPQVPR